MKITKEELDLLLHYTGMAFSEFGGSKESLLTILEILNKNPELKDSNGARWIEDERKLWKLD